MARVRRSFNPEFKAQVVLELIRGVASPAELCRRHQITPQLLATWKSILVERLPVLFGEPVDADAQDRIAELEQVLGQKTYELELLKKASRLLTGPTPRNGGSS